MCLIFVVEVIGTQSGWADSDVATTYVRALQILTTPTFTYPGGIQEGSDMVQVLH
jgi:hypothetical protein